MTMEIGPLKRKYKGYGTDRHLTCIYIRMEATRAEKNDPDDNSKGTDQEQVTQISTGRRENIEPESRQTIGNVSTAEATPPGGEHGKDLESSRKCEYGDMWRTQSK